LCKQVYISPRGKAFLSYKQAEAFWKGSMGRAKKAGAGEPTGNADLEEEEPFELLEMVSWFQHCLARSFQLDFSPKERSMVKGLLRASQSLRVQQRRGRLPKCSQID
jgi:hypothetical protein